MDNVLEGPNRQTKSDDRTGNVGSVRAFRRVIIPLCILTVNGSRRRYCLRSCCEVVVIGSDKYGEKPGRKFDLFVILGGP
jgi:hypothetical protein